MIAFYIQRPLPVSKEMSRRGAENTKKKTADFLPQRAQRLSVQKIFSRRGAEATEKYKSPKQKPPQFPMAVI